MKCLPPCVLALFVFGLGLGMAEPVVELTNHTLLGKTLSANSVVTRGRWGTPMMPNRVCGYSLKEEIVEEFVKRSLFLPPAKGDKVYVPEKK
ncbi:MAG: hypothetical protein N2035_01255 [Chthoniobacterales bacterium]|nr:hypothetical protein [Chthoniobacterales bacterium]